jgi:hypothetical protein
MLEGIRNRYRKEKQQIRITSQKNTGCYIKGYLQQDKTTLTGALSFVNYTDEMRNNLLFNCFFE